MTPEASRRFLCHDSNTGKAASEEGLSFWTEEWNRILAFLPNRACANGRRVAANCVISGSLQGVQCGDTKELLLKPYDNLTELKVFWDPDSFPIRIPRELPDRIEQVKRSSRWI